MAKNITLNLTDKELATTISSLLFSSSVNVVSNTNEEYQLELYELAKKLKALRPNIALEDIQFLKEENYEDCLSEQLISEFEKNIKSVITFEHI